MKHVKIVKPHSPNIPAVRYLEAQTVLFTYNYYKTTVFESLCMGGQTFQKNVDYVVQKYMSPNFSSLLD